MPNEKEVKSKNRTTADVIGDYIKSLQELQSVFSGNTGKEFLYDEYRFKVTDGYGNFVVEKPATIRVR